MPSPQLQEMYERAFPESIVKRRLEDIARMNCYIPPMEEEVPRHERYLSDFAITVLAIVAFAVIVPACLYVVAM